MFSNVVTLAGLLRGHELVASVLAHIAHVGNHLSERLVLVVGLPHLAIADNQQSIHCAGHSDVYSIGCSQESGAPLLVGTRQTQDDDSVFLALVAIDSVDFHQCLETVAPNPLVEFLPNQTLLFGIHADDTDQRIIFVLEIREVSQELTALGNLLEEVDNLLCLATVVNTDATVTLVMVGAIRY